MNKFISRKLIVAVGGVITTVFVNVGLPEEVAARISEVLQWVLSTYLLSQGAVDVMASKKKE